LGVARFCSFGAAVAYGSGLGSGNLGCPGGIPAFSGRLGPGVIRHWNIRPGHNQKGRGTCGRKILAEAG